VHLEVCDEGQGIAPARLDSAGVFRAPEGVGILAMRERAEQAGGRLELTSGPGGTTVRAVLPSQSRY